MCGEWLHLAARPTDATAPLCLLPARADLQCRRTPRGEFYIGMVTRAADGTPCDYWADVYGRTGVLTEFRFVETSLEHAR